MNLVDLAGSMKVAERKHKFFTPSGSVSASGRRGAKAEGHTLPGTDKFPIRNASDLANAKHDIGRTNEPRAKVIAYIDREARRLGEPGVGEGGGDKAKRRYGKMRD